METFESVFYNLSSQFKDMLERNHRFAYSNDEYQIWMLHQAHQMCIDGNISWEMFGKVMDKVITY